MKKKRYNRFKQPKTGCKNCDGKGYYLSRLDFGLSDKYRCQCSMRETKKYKDILMNYELTVGEQKKLLSQFYDNNEHCDRDMCEGRSW